MKGPYFFVDEELERTFGERVSFWSIYFRGREIGVPRCCALRYAAVEYRELRDQAAERGVAFSELGWPFIPCGIFHRGISKAEHERRLNEQEQSG